MDQVSAKNYKNLEVLLRSQDEARFGRIMDPRSCWAKIPCRPVVNLALVREFKYAYAAAAQAGYEILDPVALD
jgi:hypothetical protein